MIPSLLAQTVFCNISLLVELILLTFWIADPTRQWVEHGHVDWSANLTPSLLLMVTTILSLQQ